MVVMEGDGVVMGVMKRWLCYENDDNDKIYTCSLSTHVYREV